MFPKSRFRQINQPAAELTGYVPLAYNQASPIFPEPGFAGFGKTKKAPKTQTASGVGFLALPKSRPESNPA